MSRFTPSLTGRPGARALAMADLPSPVWAGGRRRYLSYANGGAATRTTIGATAGTPQGTLGSSASEAEGIFAPFTTGAVSGNTAGGFVFATTTGFAQRRWNPVYTCRFKTPSDLTSWRGFVGMSTAGSPAASGDTMAGDHALLRYSTGASDPGWVFYTRDNSSNTVSAQVAAIAADTAYLLVLDFRDQSKIDVWLGAGEDDLALVHSATATLPRDTVDLYPIAPHIATLTNATRSVKFSHVGLGHE